MISRPVNATPFINSPNHSTKTYNVFGNTNSLKKKTLGRNIPFNKGPQPILGVRNQFGPDSIPPFLDDTELNLLKGNILRDRLYSSSINLNSLKHHNKPFARKSTIPNPILKITKTTSASRLPQLNNNERSSFHNGFDRVGCNYEHENNSYNNYPNNNGNNIRSSNNNARRVIFKNSVSVFRFDSDGDSGCSASSEYEKQLKSHSPLTTITKPPKNFRNLPSLYGGTTQTPVETKYFYDSPKSYNSKSNLLKSSSKLKTTNSNAFNTSSTHHICDGDCGHSHLYIDDDDEEDDESGLSVSPDQGGPVVFAYSRPFERSNSTLKPDSQPESNKFSTPNSNIKGQASNQTIYFDDETEDSGNNTSPHNENSGRPSSFYTTFSSNLTPTIVTSLQPFNTQPLLYPHEPSLSEFPPTHATHNHPPVNTNISHAHAKEQPLYGYDVSIDLPQADYDLLKQQQETEALVQQQKQHQKLIQPLKQLRYPHLPYSLYLQEVKNQQEVTSNLKKQENPIRKKPETTFKYNPLLGNNNGLMITVRLGVPLQPNDVLVKANKNGSKLRIVSNHQESSLPEDLNEQILLPIQINPYKIAAKIDTSGNLLIEAPISRI